MFGSLHLLTAGGGLRLFSVPSWEGVSEILLVPGRLWNYSVEIGGLVATLVKDNKSL